MRLMYIGVTLRPDEFEILSPCGSTVEPGLIRVARSSRGASFLTLVSDLVDVCPDLHVYFVGMVSGATKEGLFTDATRPRMSWVLAPSSCWRDTGLAERFHLDNSVRLFQDNAVKVPLPLDAVLASTPFFARRHSLQLSSSKRMVPGFVRHESGYSATGNTSEAWGKPGKNEEAMDAVVAASLNVHHVFLNPLQREQYSNLFMRPNLSASSLRRFGAKSSVHLNGVSLPAIDRILGSGSLPSDPGRAVGSFTRVMSCKGTEEVLALYQRIAILGKVDRVVVTWADEKPLEDGLPATNRTVPPQFEFFPGCDREAYLKHASRTAVAVWNSRGESSPISMFECAYAGCVPVLPDRDWKQAVAPDWPLTFKTLDEALALVMLVLSDRDKYRKMAREYVQDHFSAGRVGSAFIDHVGTVSAKSGLLSRLSDDEFSKFCVGSRFVDNVATALVGVDKITWAELLKRVSLPRDVMGFPSLITHHDLPTLLGRRFGFNDVVSSTVPCFERVVNAGI